MNYIRLPDDLDLKQGLFIAVVWSMLIFGLGAYAGFSFVDIDCNTCEASLDRAIDDLHACQKQLLTSIPNKCDDERKAEQELCKVTLAKYKELRCKICGASHDTSTLKLTNDRNAHRSDD